MKGDTIYYVYVYLREQSSDTADAGTPYYVGKGKGDRVTRTHKKHGIHVPKNRDNIILLWENLTEEFALEMEMLLIATYGRVDNGTGILRNKTDGGDGTSGWIPTEENRRKIAEATRIAVQSDDIKQSAIRAQRERVNRGDHPFFDSQATSNRVRALVASGKSHLVIENPNKIRVSCIGCRKETALTSLTKHRECRGEERKKNREATKIACPECDRLFGPHNVAQHMKFSHGIITTFAEIIQKA